ncbi:hypothetical protein BDV38DRAFT_281851 [Aspergillus pseudotamarii]|uniref:Uncharacterized protein n=1 Tax=Aspergillus pseudotamarii TaxID=132259 RepID=A0A5N6SYQ1_ASPPS|nr:uncharacterized protein BDV38DRAFT_281851 [Aspergillus pseudotamarii]KAE8138543.1 hypothetical protein BDV38DRAFT_281851 [Aspergillus pseudotamarii]
MRFAAAMQSVIGKPTGKRKPGMTASPSQAFQYNAVQEFAPPPFSISTSVAELEGPVDESMPATKRSQLSRVTILTMLSSSTFLLVVVFFIAVLRFQRINGAFMAFQDTS